MMRACRKGQAATFNLTHDNRGEARLVERAFGLGPCALTEAVQLLTENLGAAGTTSLHRRPKRPHGEFATGPPEIGCTLERSHPTPVHVGAFAFKKARKWRTANGTRSFGSFHGKKVIWAFGASIAVSSATA